MNDMKWILRWIFTEWMCESGKEIEASLARYNLTLVSCGIPLNTGDWNRFLAKNKNNSLSHCGKSYGFWVSYSQPLVWFLSNDSVSVSSIFLIFSVSMNPTYKTLKAPYTEIHFSHVYFEGLTATETGNMTGGKERSRRNLANRE